MEAIELIFECPRCNLTIEPIKQNFNGNSVLCCRWCGNTRIEVKIKGSE